MSDLTLNLPTLTDDRLLELALLVSREVAQRALLHNTLLEITKRALVTQDDHFWADQPELNPERLNVAQALQGLYPDLQCRVRATWFLEHCEVTLSHENALIDVRYQAQAGMESLECAGPRFNEGSRERALLLQICRAAAMQARPKVVRAARSSKPKSKRQSKPGLKGETNATSTSDPTLESNGLSAVQQTSQSAVQPAVPSAVQSGRTASGSIDGLQLYAFIPLPDDPRFLASLLTPVTALAVLGQGDCLALIKVSASNGGWSFAKRPVVVWWRGQVNATLEAILPGRQASIERLVQGKPPSMAALKKRFAGFKGGFPGRFRRGEPLPVQPGV